MPHGWTLQARIYITLPIPHWTHHAGRLCTQDKIIVQLKRYQILLLLAWSFTHIFSTIQWPVALPPHHRVAGVCLVHSVHIEQVVVISYRQLHLYRHASPTNKWKERVEYAIRIVLKWNLLSIYKYIKENNRPSNYILLF